jgi:hypothetical protein
LKLGCLRACAGWVRHLGWRSRLGLCAADGLRAGVVVPSSVGGIRAI